MTLSTGALPKKSPGSISGAWSRWCIAAQASREALEFEPIVKKWGIRMADRVFGMSLEVFIGLIYSKIYRKTPYLMVKTMVSCRCSLKQWGNIVFFFEMKTFGRPEKHRTAVPEACCWQTKLVQRRDRGSCRGEKRRWMTQYPRSWMAGKQSTLW